MSRAWLIALVSLASCNAPSRDPEICFSLDAVPSDCHVRARAATYAELIETTRPTLRVSEELLLWCRRTGADGWTFELARPYLIWNEEGRSWVLLDDPKRWLNTEFEGEFVQGQAEYPTRTLSDRPHNHAERVASSNAWGELYKISCTHVPGGNHANQGTAVVLAWLRRDGRWQALWNGYEATRWSMGSHGVDETYDFSADLDLPLRVFVQHTYVTYPSFNDEGEPDRVLKLRRSGRLKSAVLTWETGWTCQAGPGDTWERLARKVLAFRAGYESELPGLVARLKDATGASSGERLEPGRKVVLPPGTWP